MQIECDTTPSLPVPKSLLTKSTSDKTTTVEPLVKVEFISTSVRLEKEKYNLMRDTAYNRQISGYAADSINDTFKEAVDLWLTTNQITRENTLATPADAKFRKGRKTAVQELE